MTAPMSSGRARKAVFSLALCAGLVALLAACSSPEDPDAGTNGVGKLTAAGIEKKAQAAVDGAGAVRLSGALVSQGETYRLNMRLKENGGTGSVTSKDDTFELLRIEDELFLKADAGFWTHESDADGKESAAPSTSDTEAADKLQDKYVKVPREDPSYKQLRGFTDIKVLLGGLLSLHGELTKGDYSKVGGIRTIKVIAGKGAGGTLDVSLVGVPYPLQLMRAGGAGTLTLTDWGKEFTLEAPPKGQTVDYGSDLPESSSSGG
ncbi:hypothetical protein OG349_12175 [Streptomyces sp. NBC_01317]|uniref:hypothetical protein n=1 Tax=Streptomyces sp. NBC_01317 TaxID=2903822 RepID=UPI002E137F8F|nr:hypothetical protein OG349_12175 [Streptomyces sp. NBC_01317]